jgi:hypothetical protein
MAVSKQIVVVNLHSFIDAITNSSTELFVLGDNSTIESVKEMITFMLKQWNIMAAKGCFGSHHMLNERFKLSDDGKEQIPEILKYEDCIGDIYIYTEEMYKNKGEYAWDYHKKDNIGKIIIEGATDNSIPSEMFEWIESAFGYKTRRCHLG